MLTQQYKNLSRKVRFVNAALIATTSFAAIGVMPTTANALVSESAVVKTVHSVKFTRSETKTASGLESVYAKMTSKARRACMVGNNVNDLGQPVSKKRCAADLVNQFVIDADIDELTAFHKGKAAILQTAALN
ncbi:UrcA family protein [Fretibacter rubidus]|uniref:UrcA family protein n=1 Tax=Fretibacter rubidus TaxID=570162 RepID=UPI00352A1336